MSLEQGDVAPGAFAPLRERVFLVLWLATVFGNTGTWMRDTASAWLMTSLDPSPTLVALVQASTSLPIFLLALPAGALADIVDRRRLMVAIQMALAMVSLALALCTFGGLMRPALLLLLTFLGGIGAALTQPAWQSIVPELVPRALLRPAVALNSLGTNIARAIGPAVAGLIIAAIGTAWAYVADVVSYLLVISALLWWPRQQRTADAPERLFGAMRAGVRFALHQPSLQRVLLRVFLFFISASAHWALLPLIVRQQLHGSAADYGLAMTAVGAGAIAGALLLPRLRDRVGINLVVLIAALATAPAMALLALARVSWQGQMILFFAGGAWIAALTTLNACAQSSLPNWVRGRGLAVYLTVFFGAMTVGSLFWGRLASEVGVPVALLVAAISGGGLAMVAHRWRLPEAEGDNTPSLHWPEPAFPDELDRDGGPVMVRVLYCVSPERHSAFRETMLDLARIRRRDGAYAWGLSFCLEEQHRVQEWFLVESWQEHLRQHHRVSHDDRDVQDRALAFHEGAEPPRVEHHLDLRYSVG